jgi:hypothetical protein
MNLYERDWALGSSARRPSAGMTRIRFQGVISARPSGGHPSRSKMIIGVTE